MNKKIFFIIAAILILGLSLSYGAGKPDRNILLRKPIDKEAKIKLSNEIYYVWVLMDDGCFYLFRVEVVGGILEFWTPMGPHNFVGANVNCIFKDEIDSIC